MVRQTAAARLTSSSTSLSFAAEARSSAAGILLTLATGFLADENNSFCYKKLNEYAVTHTDRHTHTI